MIVTYTARKAGRIAAKRIFRFRDPKGEKPNDTLEIKPGKNDIPDETVKKFLGNSQFLRTVLLGALDAEGLLDLAVKAVATWAKDENVSSNLVDLAEKAKAAKAKPDPVKAAAVAALEKAGEEKSK